ncbi:MAG: leucyl/phenylalanyl-tRNA--protein transferase [Alphaproteobacteria bacterium]|nr:leucyl/phenylalanyl-tRNA--protein transferase [Alphaproteobacteria bacterium]
MQLVLTPELLLEAYRQGLFPMSYSADSPYIHWVCPEMRGQLSIEKLHVPRRLKKTVRSSPYEVRIDTAFEQVIGACATATETRPETWINRQIENAFIGLYARGYAHSVECWRGSELVGGLYGLAIGGAFFGESMFSRARDASKIALVHLAARLSAGGFTLLDTQFVNDHLEQFGVYEVPHETYKKQLIAALEHKADFKLKGRGEDSLLEAYWRKNSGA